MYKTCIKEVGMAFQLFYFAKNEMRFFQNNQDINTSIGHTDIILFRHEDVFLT